MTFSALIKTELYKLKKSKPFFFGIIICAALAVFFIYSVRTGIMTRVSENVAETLARVSVASMLEDFFPLPFVPTIFAVFVTLFVCGEFHHGTVKSYISKGANRILFYLSKLAICCAAILAMFAFTLGVFCITGIILFQFDPYGTTTVSNMAAMLLCEALLHLAYVALFVFFSMSLRNTAAAMVVNIAMVNFINTALLMIGYAIGKEDMLADYWIAGKIAALATLIPEEGALFRGCILALGYIAGGTVLGSILFKKRDIS